MTEQSFEGSPQDVRQIVINAQKNGEQQDSSRRGAATMQELLACYIKQRRNLDAGSVFAIGHETVITALRLASPHEAIVYLEEKMQLNATNLALYKGERANGELALLMRKLLGKRVRLYTRVMSQIKQTPEYQKPFSSPPETVHS